MGVVTLIQSGVGVTAVYPINILQQNNATHFYVFVDGTATYSVQLTADDIYADGFDPSAANWVVTVGNFTNQTASQVLTTSGAWKGFRLNVTSGSGTVRLKMRQANIKNYFQ